MSDTHDQLTGLPGRPALERALSDATTAPEGVALALVDLDYFKEVNDALGHQVGDEVLRAVAGILSEALPGGVYRIGGDEFAVVMPDASLEQAFLRMEGVRARVEAARIPESLAGAQRSGPEGRTITITVGVAQCPRDAKDAQELISAADSAQSAAKESGRNQVGLPPNEKMVMKSCYYSSTSLRRLDLLAKRLGRKESRLLREALDDLLRKYDVREA